MGTEELIAAMFVIFLAGAAQSMTGFGFGLVAVPLMTLFLAPSAAIPIIVITGLFVNLMILWQGKRQIRLGGMSSLAVAGLAGVPVGVWLLASMEASTLRIYIGVLMLAAGLVFASGLRVRVANERLAAVPVGLASGVMGGSVSMPAPPIILFFANQKMAPADFRANLVLVVTLQLLVSLPVYYANDLLPQRAFVWSAAILPALLVGTVIGSRLIGVVSERGFRRLTLATVIAAGVISLLTGLGFI
ncbi:MAG: sulfite exporter TauE/SafE family protein [Dehalococcoidia bacterium]